MKRCRIEICMGSSCHARGNYDNAEFLKRFAAGREDVELVGTLCENGCSEGPVVRVDGRIVRDPDPRSLEKLLEDLLTQTGATERNAWTV